VYRHAARQTARATEHIRRCAATDPAIAADAAWAAADTLHVAARALGNRDLRSAADSYGRAARARHGWLPRRSRDGDQLRHTARLIAVTGELTDDTTLIAIALVAQLGALAAAVADLRLAQQHAAQAAAARATTTHLHTALTHARSGAPQPGRSRAEQPARAARAAHQDFRSARQRRLRPVGATSCGPAPSRSLRQLKPLRWQR
jgi:hypothetical protein